LADLPHQVAGHQRIAVDIRHFPEALLLDLPRPDDAVPDGFAFLGIISPAGQLFNAHRRHLYMQINPVEQRAGDFVEVFFHYPGPADTFLFRMIVIAARAPVRCIFVNLTLKCKRPINPVYPTNLNTLGDHLRKVRLDRGLSQPQVAKTLKVTTDTVTGWELNRHQPPARLAKRIIQFLEYIPSKGGKESLGTRLRLARQILGHT